MSRPSDQSRAPRVRNTGSQAFWLRMVPKPPGEAPISPTGLPPNTRGMSAAGRDSQSTAFFITPGIELLYSGVTKQQAVGDSDAVLQRLHHGRNAFGRLEVAVVQRNAADRGDAQLHVGRHQLDRGAQERTVERALTQAAGKADERGHADGSPAPARSAGSALGFVAAAIATVRVVRDGPSEVPAQPARTNASRRQRVKRMRPSDTPATHVTSGITLGVRRRIESVHEAAPLSPPSCSSPAARRCPPRPGRATSTCRRTVPPTARGCRRTSRRRRAERAWRGSSPPARRSHRPRRRSPRHRRPCRRCSSPPSRSAARLRRRASPATSAAPGAARARSSRHRRPGRRRPAPA